ncbi:MAG: hypothetical protein ACRC7S_05670 [Cetobacterium sp.]
MRKYNHDTEILIYSNCYEYVKKMEIIIIQNFKDLGYDVLNMTRGGDGVVNPTEEVRVKLREANKRSVAIRSKPIEYYEENSSTKDVFEEICINRNLDYNKFYPIYSKERNTLSGIKRYYFYKINSDTVNRHFKILDIIKSLKLIRLKKIKEIRSKIKRENTLMDKIENSNIKPISSKTFNSICEELKLNKDHFKKETVKINNKIYKFKYTYTGVIDKNLITFDNKIKYHEKVPTMRKNFKNMCKARGLNFENFDEIFNGDYYICKGSRKKKYTYIVRV